MNRVFVDVELDWESDVLSGFSEAVGCERETFEVYDQVSRRIEEKHSFDGFRLEWFLLFSVLGAHLTVIKVFPVI